MNKPCISLCRLLSVLLISCSGCAHFSGPGRYNIRIQRETSLKNLAIEVDVIGVTEEDKNTSADVNKYWSDALKGPRLPKTISLQFSPGQQDDAVLKVSGKTESEKNYRNLLNDKRILYLEIISDYPSLLEDPGAKDPRRCRVSLRKKEHRLWAKELKFLIDKDGRIDVTTP